MKKIALLLLSITLVVASCKKGEGDQAEIVPGDTLPSSFTKRVLLEDYTKHCQFCIPVNSMIDSMRDAYPNRTLIPVLISAYHTTQIPYFDSIKTIFIMTSFPKAGIDRLPAINAGAETGNFVYAKENWATNIDLELLKTTDFGLKLNTMLSGNNLNVTVKVGALSAASNKKLSVFIIEDDAYYRTIRKVVTDFKGESLTLSANGISEKTYNNIDVNGLNLARTSVVAFVHSFDESSQNFEIDNVNEVAAGSSVSW
tara:strand:+ start:164 stop:931 length:768 start_codon:yes stop_codon:yes gene_type:complete